MLPLLADYDAHIYMQADIRSVHLQFHTHRAASDYAVFSRLGIAPNASSIVVLQLSQTG